MKLGRVHREHSGTGGRQLRVCYFGTYRANYSRNQIMIEGLRRNGVEVIECHVPLWRGIEDRVRVASGGWLHPVFILRVVRTYLKLLWDYRKISEYDVMVLGYPGQIDVYPARMLTWAQRKPLVLDVFMSLYLIASERGLTVSHPFTGKLIYWLEKLAYRLPDLLIQDTVEYIEWLRETYDLDSPRFRLVPTGADDRIFQPMKVDKCGDGLFRVLYYGTFIPNHGVEYIIEAARILRKESSICFELIGEGPMKAHAMALAREYGLMNVRFVDWIDKELLVRKAAEANVLLGVFGTTPQSLMTVQNKLYEAIAMSRPLITGDSPTVREHLVDGKEVLLVPRGDPQAIVQAIQQLRDNPLLAYSLAERGHKRYQAEYSIARIGERFRQHLEELLAERKRA